MCGDCGVSVGAIHTDSFGYVGTGDDASSVTTLVSSGAVRTVSACIGNGAASERMSIARDKAKGREKKKIKPPRALTPRPYGCWLAVRGGAAQNFLRSALPPNHAAPHEAPATPCAGQRNWVPRRLPLCHRLVSISDPLPRTAAAPCKAVGSYVQGSSTMIRCLRALMRAPYA